MSTRSKYFIAIIPPSPIYEEAYHWKLFFQEKYNTKAALRSPPHITLHMPFEWPSSKVARLLDSIGGFAKSCSPFELQLRGFGSFPPRVIFIRVGENKHLNDLQSDLIRFCRINLNLFNANRLDLPYHPHLTVAFRDLKKSLFEEAWDSVQDESFNHDFACTQITLLKHNGKSWDIDHQFGFQS